MLPEEEQQRDDKNKRNPLKDKNPRKGGSKFSIYWVYAIIAAVLIGMQFFKSDNDIKSID